MSLIKQAQRICLVAAAGVTCCVVGCSGGVEHPIVFEPNLVHTMKYQIQNDIPMDQASKDSTWVVETMFGTPDHPKLPDVVMEDEDLSKIISNKGLNEASGSPEAKGRGLYRLLCSTCHGVTGNGRGPSGSAQVPYPRDYRMGVFKFKSTSRGTKPTRNDLAKLIRGGIAGTNMTSVDKLLETEKFRRRQMHEPAVDLTEITEENVQALVDYVIYLSWRGEHERRQIDMAMLDGIIEDGERVINSEFGARVLNDEAFKASLEKAEDEDEETLDETMQENLALYERFQEDWEYAEDYAIEIGESWLEADEEVLGVPDPPTDFPLAESYADVVSIRKGPQADEFEASVKRGQELFVGKVATCSKCHGEKGLGNGQTTDYDDWTKDWTSRVGIKPENREALIPMLARGALPPMNAIPRNFAQGVFRGGSNSKDLYRRIMQGIDGTPMPAATFVEGQFEEGDVWHLINFIRSLQTEEAGDQPAAPDEAPAV
ncbi:MAG: cytochrome c [Rubripirellula sp.]